jgi:hypothetical protein
MLASIALGAGGAYQSTKDGKTTVWNSKPRPGEAADWSGKRDRDGYATGFGTLTWFNAKGTVYARYYGNVVRGKLNGPVNVHSKGKTGHAYFVEGERSTPWATGPAPLRMVAPEGAESAKKQEVATEKPATPAGKQKREVRGQKPEVSAAVSNSESVREQASQPSEADRHLTETPEAEPQAPAEKAAQTSKKTKKSERALLAPGEVRPIEHVVPRSENIHEETSKWSKSAKAENTPPVEPRRGGQAATSGTTRATIETSPPVEPTPIAAAAARELTETPRVEETPQGQRSDVRDQRAEGSNLNENSATSPLAPNATANKEVDDSLKSLVAPPSSLRSTPAPSPSATPE